jgi:hypothetical protein
MENVFHHKRMVCVLNGLGSSTSRRSGNKANTPTAPQEDPDLREASSAPPIPLSNYFDVLLEEEEDQPDAMEKRLSIIRARRKQPRSPRKPQQ